MAGVQDAGLAAAVSNAGGLGSVPCALLTPVAMRGELTRLAAESVRPYNVNFFCHALPRSNPERERSWHELLAPYYLEFGIEHTAIRPAALRRPFDSDAANVIEDVKPAVVSFHFGLPEPDLLARVRATGARILATATTVDEARWLEARGVDAVIAQGLEAGGHRGNFLSVDLTMQTCTFELLERVLQAVNVPVVAAGGISDAADVRAALAFGAGAVQVGTAYLLAREATTSHVHRAAVASDAGRHTAVTNLFSGRPARGIVNRLMRELGPIRPDVPEFPLASGALAPLRAKAEAQGLGDFSPLWAGEKASECRAMSAGDITRALAGM